MNCKPGDLARIIHVPFPEDRHLLGRIVQVKVLDAPNGLGMPSWTYEPTQYYTSSLTGERNPIECIPDSILRPISNPGDDAVDEVILRLGKPGQTDTPSERPVEESVA